MSDVSEDEVEVIYAHIADNVPEPNLIEDDGPNVNYEPFVVHDGDSDVGENYDFEAGLDLAVDEGAKEVVDGLAIDKRLYSRLYPYQREGVRWMWKLHKSNKGGILADDMGLGKTVQVIAFLTGLLNSKIIKSALIVVPFSLIANWESEIANWGDGFKTLWYHGDSKNKEINLSRIQKNGGVLLTSYGTLSSCVNKLKTKAYNDQNFSWDYVILDEGHKIKNPTKTTKAAHKLSAHHRLVLTGTPIQNNLMELWALYDFCHQGTLLGNFDTFKLEYETPINKSREKDATAEQMLLGTKMAENLRDLIKPYFLRRTKADTIEAKENFNLHSKSCAKIPRKNEFVMWLYLSPQQIDIYEQFLESDEVKRAVISTMSPVVELVALKKICDHPRLFTKRACKILALNDGNKEASTLNDSREDEVSHLDVESSLLLKESGKMKFLISLLETLREQSHRTLVFSRSRRILDIIEKILNERRFKLIRLDGSVTNLDDRQAIIYKFQSDSNISVFLLTKLVGGVGLTITEANRVVIYDPDWNPAVDAQAVDRAYRIGQKRDVVVYRLITCGTIEEKMYRRQIFKDSITRQATSDLEQDRDPHRYFTEGELHSLFFLEEPTYSNTQVQLHALHAHNRRTSPELNAHIKYLESLKDLLFGISDHDLMFKGTPPNDFIATDDEKDYINKKVQGAQELLKRESKRNERLAKLRGAYETTYFPEDCGPFDRANFPVNDPEPLPLPNLISDDEDERAEIIDLDSYLLYSSYSRSSTSETFKNKPLGSTSAECITIDSDSDSDLPDININSDSDLPILETASVNSKPSSSTANCNRAKFQEFFHVLISILIRKMDFQISISILILIYLFWKALRSTVSRVVVSMEFSPSRSKKRHALTDETEYDVSFRKKFNINFPDSYYYS